MRGYTFKSAFDEHVLGVFAVATHLERLPVHGILVLVG
jgi:hypothetical protein